MKICKVVYVSTTENVICEKEFANVLNVMGQNDIAVNMGNFNLSTQ